MKAIAILALALCIVAASAEDYSSVQFWAWLNGAGQAEDPVVATDAQGICVFWYDDVSMDLYGRCHHNISASDTVTMSHIHGPNEGSTVSGTADAIITGSIYGSDSGIVTFDASAIDVSTACYMFAGMTYVNVHTSAAPSGLIRGQILPVDDDSTPDFFAVLDDVQAGYVSNDNEEYALLSSKAGVAAVYRDDDELWVNMFHNQDATVSHIHGSNVSLPGTAAGALYGLCNMDDVSDFGASCDAKNGMLIDYHFTEDADLVAWMDMGLCYINVHTTTYPNGAIRGQIMMPASAATPSSDECAPYTGSPASTVQVGFVGAMLMAMLSAFLL